MKIMAIIITTIIRLTSDIPGFGSPRRLSIYERNEIDRSETTFSCGIQNHINQMFILFSYKFVVHIHKKTFHIFY